MKKVLIIVAVALIILGAVICTAAAASMKFDFRKLDNSSYETNTYAVNEKFSGISMEATTEKIIFRPSEDGKCKVVCVEDEGVKHEVGVSNGTLVIKEKDERKLGLHLGINSISASTTVYLPESSYGMLSISTDTGDMDIPADFTFENADIKADTADVDFYASVADLLRIKLSTGDIEIDGITAGEMELSASTGHMNISSVSCAGNLSASVTTGKIRLGDIRCKNLLSEGTTGDLEMKNVIVSDELTVRRDTGDVKFDACDAGTIFVETDTGNVTGTLLSEKVIYARSDTGKVSVPRSTTGGRCEISTDTGRIEIEIK